MSEKRKPKIMITFREGGQNGGPYISHRRIMESKLKEKYEFVPLIIPKGRLGILNIFKLWKMVKSIRETQPDIVHYAGLELVGWYSMLASKLAGIKNTILAIHGSSLEAAFFPWYKRIVMKAIEVITLKNAAIVYGVSDYVSSWKRSQKYTKKYYGTIYNLPGERGKMQSDFRKNMGFSDEDILIVSTGRIEIEKGFATLLKMIVEHWWDSNIKFIIVGEGSYLGHMKSVISAADKSTQVFFMGYQQDVRSILLGCDIFVLCTWHETLCNSVVEASGVGLPVIATNVGGIPEIVSDGKSGFLVDNQIEEYITKLRILIADENLRKRMGHEAKKLIDQKLNEETIIQQIDEVYSYFDNWM
ncbi:glycosyltransferase [Ructibacterium gallinarum]|uniref:Glycosyltransferase n=1 Tax=Ructibacterium gallinarum TaxID=2779355 RepID=A0A9D5R8D6_9FIRM|nr:glycosyltransferase [Ructibacterium gallinarum]MBE5039339.1 glycosyltransferase [Ructibacterium gallinarum]